MSRFLPLLKVSQRVFVGVARSTRVNRTFTLNTIRSFATSDDKDEYKMDKHLHHEAFLIKAEVEERVLGVVKNFEKINPAVVTPQSRFKEDLDLDSLDAVEIVLAVEEEFNIEIPDSEADKMMSIPDIVAYVSTHPMVTLLKEY